ncbi:MAG: LacI family DNA-binding transcriptional regulator [Verrucomicrobiota bacterium JB024]|nr:LacI family DNA-binding transcriptional regulator [Verrucomicrobiota bacterium JB024]
MTNENTGKGRVTVRRIAEEAGLTIGSVSSVLNNKHVERRISPATVAKVRETAARLGYMPNINARRLRSGSESLNTVTLAVITSYEAPLTLVNNIIKAIRTSVDQERKEGSPYHYTVTIEMFPAGDLGSVPGLLAGSHFNAAIITNTTPKDDHFLQRNQLPYPVVLVNRATPGYAHVYEEPEIGASAADMLVDAGRKRLAVLHGSPVTQVIDNRTSSFMRQVSERLGAPVHEIVAGTLTESAAAEAMARFFDGGKRIDGLYAVTDGMALGAYHAIKQAGLTIPDDVAVVAAGDYNFSSLFDPPLATVGADPREQGAEAVRLLLDLIHQRRSRKTDVVMPGNPSPRASVGQA